MRGLRGAFARPMQINACLWPRPTAGSSASLVPVLPSRWTPLPGRGCVSRARSGQRLRYLPSRRRTAVGGVGTRLMEVAEAWARGRGAVLATVDTYVGSHLSVPFYLNRMRYDIQSLRFLKRLSQSLPPAIPSGDVVIRQECIGGRRGHSTVLARHVAVLRHAQSRHLSGPTGRGAG